MGAYYPFKTQLTLIHKKKPNRTPRLPYLKSIPGRGICAIFIIFFVRRKKKLTHHFVTIWLYIVSRSGQICRVRKLTWHRLEARNPCMMHIQRSADEARKMCSLRVLVSFGGGGGGSHERDATFVLIHNTFTKTYQFSCVYIHKVHHSYIQIMRNYSVCCSGGKLLLLTKYMLVYISWTQYVNNLHTFHIFVLKTSDIIKFFQVYKYMHAWFFFFKHIELCWCL